ncbi:hypothetical protein KL921_002925 [Ogataea angusta]|uniref:AMP-activated protein kinase glycogen-binding domain-containing protein n=1 Tax=Pichia angusta TaxID=870730 RepID=A0AAN6DDY3_PICAN|nr:uncharacterized protein KL928_003160 [Ogataea angusta]KAG7810430.1 hypothetical protein KL921_002925 [Ogataea angusta]KAG7818159.1 hypothetical protein KL928_003160 [Ogataea angusta]KAG7839980.1 hypothetical protein KL942_002779 [Ogataea angusta]KAG7846639.1 hypothetical protein KL940_004237 [Ogataea angusta]
MTVYKYRFEWLSNDAKQVYVTGSFDNWSKTCQLDKTGVGFAKVVELPFEKIVFKFVVDNQWYTSENDKKEYDECGNLNNVLYPDDLIRYDNEDGASEFTAISYPDADGDDAGRAGQEQREAPDQEDLGSSTQVTLKDEYPMSEPSGHGILARLRSLFK